MYDESDYPDEPIPMEEREVPMALVRERDAPRPTLDRAMVGQQIAEAQDAEV